MRSLLSSAPRFLASGRAFFLISGCATLFATWVFWDAAESELPTAAGFWRLIAQYTVLALGANLLLLGLFLPLLRQVVRPGPPLLAEGNSESWCQSERILAVGVIAAAVLVALWLALPRMDLSLWGDELWSLRESTAGQFARDYGDGNLKASLSQLYWEQLSWEQTIWRYLTTNHHFLFAIGTRAVTDASHALFGTPPWEVNEFAFRLLPLIFGLTGIVLWSRILRSTPLACALLAATLAIHPWYLRYATEGRGYALLFVFLPWLIMALQSAVTSNRWRAWAAVAISQFLALYSWPGVFPSIVGIQIAVLVAICRIPDRSHRPNFLRGWFAANLVCAMLLAQLLTPCVPQILGHLTTEFPRWTPGAQWIAEEFSHFVFGVDFFDNLDYSRTNPLYISIESMLRSRPIATLAALAIAVPGFLWGCVIWWRRIPLGASILCGSLFSSIIAFLLARSLSVGFYHWYLVHLLPMAVAIFALGLVDIARVSSKALPSKNQSVRETGARLVAAMVFVGLYVSAATPQLKAIRTHPLDPRRESVAATRVNTDHFDTVHLETITAHISQHALNYDTHGWLIKRARVEVDGDNWPGLVPLMRLADETGATLLVNTGGVHSLAERYVDIAKLLEQEQVFTLVEVLHGLEPQFERHIYRYLGGLFDF